MIWRILHFIFKFDYIYYEHSVITGTITGVARVHKMPCGKPSINYVFRTQYSDGDGRRFKKLCFIEDLPDKVKIIWLTCKREKYFPMSEDEWIQEFEKYEQAEKCIIGMIEDSEELGSGGRH